MIEVFWTIAGNGKDHRLKFKWKESGGPVVVAPIRYGLGTSLIKSTFTDVRLSYLVAGLICEIELPSVMPGLGHCPYRKRKTGDVTRRIR
jgi:two-component sensor histidine kinase